MTAQYISKRFLTVDHLSGDITAQHINVGIQGLQAIAKASELVPAIAWNAATAADFYSHTGAETDSWIVTAPAGGDPGAKTWGKQPTIVIAR